MKYFFKLLLVLLIPCKLLAQDPAVVKQQANTMAKTLLKGDYKTFVDYMYPRMVQIMGGKEKIISVTSASMAQMKEQGMALENASIGTPGKFYKAGKELHCLVPEVITLKTTNGVITSHSNLLAISADGGKNWTFLDLNKNTVGAIPKLFPYFNPNLKIPAPEQ